MTTTLYTEDHEWLEVDGDIATIGITNFAQEQLGEVVFVELPQVGAFLTSGDSAVVVESVKAASDVYAPVSGEVTEVNDKVGADPALVNSAPTGDGWLWKMRLSDTRQLERLMDETAYHAHSA